MEQATTRIRAKQELWSDSIQLAVFHLDFDGGQSVAEPLTMREIKQGETIGDPTLTLSRDEAQALMDELWNCNLRPREGTGSAGMLAATERHLADMKAIAFNLLKLS